MTRSELEEEKIHLQSLEDKLIALAEEQRLNVIHGQPSPKINEKIELTMCQLMSATFKFCDRSKFISYRPDKD